MYTAGEVRPAGTLGLTVVRGDGSREEVVPVAPRSVEQRPLSAVPDRWLTFRELIEHGAPRRGLHPEVNAWRERNWPELLRQWSKVALGRAFARRMGLLVAHGRLSLTVIRGDGEVLDLGLASFRVVTNAGRDYIIDAFENLTEVENFKFHAIGTGTNAEAAGDTALQTELTTQYNPDNTRATGSQTENGSGVYRTVGTNTLDSGTPAVTEHGILTQAATGGGTLLDRSVFSAFNLAGASGDGLQSTYDLSIASGG